MNEQSALTNAGLRAILLNAAAETALLPLYRQVRGWISDEQLCKLPTSQLRFITAILDGPPGDAGPARLAQARQELEGYLKRLDRRVEPGPVRELSRRVRSFLQSGPGSPLRALADDAIRPLDHLLASDEERVAAKRDLEFYLARRALALLDQLAVLAQMRQQAPEDEQPLWPDPLRRI